MRLKQHTIQASVGSAILAPFLGIDTIVFFLSMILIDVDHYFEFAFVCRRLGIRDMFRYYDWTWQVRHSIYALSLFHTAEVMLSLFLLGFWSHYFWLIFFGFSLHLLFDLYHLYIYKCFFNRAFSVIEYIIRRRGIICCRVPEKEFWDNAK